MLRSDLCVYSAAYIVVKGKTDLFDAAANENNKADKNIAFKKNAPFRSSISKIDSTLIDNTEDLDIVMPIYNLLEYSQNYSIISESLWNYYRDGIDDISNNASDEKLLKLKTKFLGKTPERSPQPENPGDAQSAVYKSRVLGHFTPLRYFWT